MPRYRVKAPDGRAFIVNAPEGATKEQVLAFAQKNMPAPKKREGILGAVNRFVSSGNEMLIGGVEGLYNAASAVTDPVIHKISSLVQGKDVADASLAATNRSRRAVSDTVSRAIVAKPNPIAREVGRVASTVVAPVPKIGLLEKAGTAGRLVQRAYQGAVGGAAVRDVDDSAAAPAATGAIANVILPPIISRIAQTRPVQAAAKVIERYAAPAVSEVAPSLAPLGRKAQARAARFKAVGVDEPTTGMVTRDPNAFAFERNSAKIDDVGESLQQQIQNVEASLVAKGQELVGKAGGSKGAEATGKAVQDALDTKRAEMQRVTSGLYKQVREARGDQPIPALEKFGAQLDDPDMVDNAVFDQMRTSLVRRMERMDNGEQITIKQAEDLRKFIGGLGDGRDPSVRMMRGRLIDALDDDVVEAAGDDAFKAARASAKARFDEFGKTFAGKIADEGIAPEALTRRVLSDSTRLSDLRAMRTSLTTGTDEQISRGKDAWNALRAQALDDFLTASTDANGQLMGAQLAKNFTKQAPKFRELLDPEDYKLLRRLVNATKDAKVAPSQSGVNFSNTAPTMANLFQSLRPATRQGWKRLLMKSGAHTVAFTTTGPMGNLALFTGMAVAKDIGEAKAANALLRRIQMAKSPEEAAAAVKAMQEAAKTDPAVRKLLDQLGPATGAAGASQAQ